MITLFQYPSVFDIPNLSSFCVKTESFLKLSGLDYKIVDIYDPSIGPKNKAPFIEDSGEKIGDSTHIIQHLKDNYQVKICRDLTPEEAAISQAFQTLVEEHLYWCVVHSRWLEDENWPLVKEIFFGGMPAILKQFVTKKIRKMVANTLYQHGLGRHSSEEIYDFAEKDIKAISDFLGDKRYFHGNDFTEIDIIIYSITVNLRLDQFHGPMKGFIKKYSNLNDHCDRVAEYIDFTVKQRKQAA